MKKLWERFCTLSRAKQIAAVVFCLHFALICALSVHHLIHSKKGVKTKIAVRTVRPLAQKAPVSTTRPPSNPKPAKIASQPKPTQKGQSTAPKAPAKTSTAPKNSKGTSAPAKISAEKEILLQEIAESLEILHSEVSSPPSRFALSLPSSLTKQIQIDEAEVADLNYTEILIAFLQDQLDLPEYGEVKVRFEIDPKGQLSHLEILESQNRKNGEFLKTRLPELYFPPGGESNTFTITFKNRERQ